MCQCLNYENLTLEAWKDLSFQRPRELQTPCSSSKPQPMPMSYGKRGTLCGCLDYEKLALKA